MSYFKRSSMLRGMCGLVVIMLLGMAAEGQAQIGRRFPAEKKVIKDPVTGVTLTFLTSQPGMGDQKIYQTHPQWTADGAWIVFRSDRVRGEAMAVHEKSGEIVQITEGGYFGMLNLARKSMKLYFLQRSGSSVRLIEDNLDALFRDSRSNRLKEASYYQRVCGTIPDEMGAGGDMALDADEEWVYFRVGAEEARRHLPEGTVIEPNFGPRHMGAGPSGIARMQVKTGEIRYVVSVPFQIGHIQCNPWLPGEIVFCWETGGKSPQRTWTVRADGSGLRPVYRESEHDWVTHEAVITPDEVAIAIMGHRPVKKDGMDSVVQDPTNPGQEPGWGPCGTRAYPTGLGIVNLRTGEMLLAGQTDQGSGFWHVNGSADGRWAAGDDFDRHIYLINRQTRQMMLLSAGHKKTAADHPHPTFSPDGSRIEIQSAMLSPDGRSMNICVITIPKNAFKGCH